MRIMELDWVHGAFCSPVKRCTWTKNTFYLFGEMHVGHDILSTELEETNCSNRVRSQESIYVNASPVFSILHKTGPVSQRWGMTTPVQSLPWSLSPPVPLTLQTLSPLRPPLLPPSHTPTLSLPAPAGQALTHLGPGRRQDDPCDWLAVKTSCTKTISQQNFTRAENPCNIYWTELAQGSRVTDRHTGRVHLEAQHITIFMIYRFMCPTSLRA